MIELALVTGVVAAPASAVWAPLADFGAPQQFAPSIERCVMTATGVGAVRMVHSSRGLCIHERLLECDPVAYRLRYEALDTGDMPFPGMSHYESTVTLTTLGDATTQVTWWGCGRIDGPIAPVHVFLTRLYTGAIDALTALSVRAP